jgi:erythromycin esterase-like protein
LIGGINSSKHNFKSDIDEIIRIANNVKILGMAEATHGQNEITKFRIKVFKQLVKKCNYTVFVLEDQYSCCEQINRYIKKGKGNLRELLLQLMWFWRSFDMLNLIKWMRKYNIKHGTVLEFKGIDIQTICNNSHNKNDPVANYTKRKSDANNNVDQDNWVVADEFRDKSMFGVFMKIYDPLKKYFFYAHNYHVSKKDLVGGGNIIPGTEFEGRLIRKGQTVNWFGSYLSKRFGSAYFAIGNVFTSGGYLETSDIIEQIDTSGRNANYQKFKESDEFVIIKNIPIVGKINPHELPNGLTVFDDPTDKAFDAIMVIKHETPIKLISYESPY